MCNNNIKINEDKVLKILDIISDENLYNSSHILARAMVLNYDMREKNQEYAKKPQLAPGLDSVK